jgi:hypothetical protein
MHAHIKMSTLYYCKCCTWDDDLYDRQYSLAEVNLALHLSPCGGLVVSQGQLCLRFYHVMMVGVQLVALLS